MRGYKTPKIMFNPILIILSIIKEKNKIKYKNIGGSDHKNIILISDSVWSEK